MEHDAFLYKSDDEFAAGMGPFALDGLAAGEAVVAVTGSANAGILRDLLGDDAHRVRFIDADQWYRRPARTVAAYHRLVGDCVDAGASRVRVIGEVVFGSEAREHAEWTRYESVLNRAFAGAAAWIVCPYDERRLPARVVEDARRTHPWVIHGGRRSPSPEFVSPEELVPGIVPPASSDGARPLLEIVPGDDLAGVRAEVDQAVRAEGLAGDGAQSLVLGLNEVLTNALRYGGGIERVVLLRSRRALHCEVMDRGSGPLDPLVGFLPPDLTAEGGFGLWIARQLCDEVEINPGPQGTVVRLSMRLPSVLDERD